MGTLTNRNVKRYLREFPFLSGIVDLRNLDPQSEFYTPVSIEVSVMDTSSLYLHPEFWVDKRFISNNKGWSTRGAGVYLIDICGDIVHRFFWTNYPTPIKSIIKGKDGVRMVALVGVTTWYRHDPASNYAGELSHYEYEIHIFKSPHQGIQELVKQSILAENVPISDILAINLVSMYGEPEFVAAIERLGSIKDRFKQTIGKNNWSEISQKIKWGLSGEIGGTQVLVFYCSGSITMTLSRFGRQITFVGDSKNYRNIGINSVTGTVDEIAEIVEMATCCMDISLLHEDGDVFFGGY